MAKRLTSKGIVFAPALSGYADRMISRLDGARIVVISRRRLGRRADVSRGGNVVGTR